MALFVGEYRRKGLATVIRAIGKLPDAPVHLLAVGKGDLEQYQSLAAQAGITNRVTFAPPARDIEQVFGAADLFVFPTYYEPFGMVITEAMASGLPVITSRNAGAAEMITEGVSGLLLDKPGDADELSQKITMLLSDEALRRDMGMCARPAAAAYGWSHVAADTLRLYHRSLAGENPLVATTKQAS